MIENQILIRLRETNDFFKKLEASSLSKSEQVDKLITSLEERGSGWLEERVIRTKQEVQLKEKTKQLISILKEENKKPDNKNDMINPVSSRGDGLNMLFRVPVD
ncbi:hypothetical protein CROQUDRAFT_655170 [Cronartium quercuum f. sp. fusiforme G11]|uniref:Uncharacterized protein n=1 Tax=Cronartium quercuum f. sp. fusiforme G11 TaxID=708437 RepID=A0A9P6TDD3_9BASI|nr:hypothetical protein CROQUDRAFT_655170 [Cronartium quercuum f. sp. fusiforme G11]